MARVPADGSEQLPLRVLTPAAAAVGAVFGAAVGSFLNVVVHRLPKGESVVRPRSRCPECGEQIAPRDNVPVLSWMLLRGRCRNCGAAISRRYPAVEALTAALFALIVAVHGVEIDLLLWLPLAAALVAITFIDLDHRIIPNKIVVPALIWGIAAAAVVSLDDFPWRLVAGAGAFTFLLLAALAYPGGMGMGDVKLAGVMGVYLGASVIPALFAAFIAGSVVGVSLMARHGIGERKRGVPFGPFLALGGAVAVLAGTELIDVYRENFL